MSTEKFKYFFSYAREDAEFVLKLAKELRAGGANLWVDQLDILGGQHWDRAVEQGLKSCQGMIIVLSPGSVESTNVMDEVSYALEEGKLVVPILFRPCDIPFRLRRVHHIDFTAGYDSGLSQLKKALRLEHGSLTIRSNSSEKPAVPELVTTPKETPIEDAVLETPSSTIEVAESEIQVGQERKAATSEEKTVAAGARAKGIESALEDDRPIRKNKRKLSCPSYLKAFGLHILLGFGMFYVDSRLKRRWLYVFLPLYAIMDVALAISGISLFRGGFGLTTFAGALILYVLSFIDIAVSCRRRRSSSTAFA